MSYKMKQDESPMLMGPFEDYQSLGLGSQSAGAAAPAGAAEAAGAAGGGFNAGGAGAIAGLAGGIVNEVGETDPTKGGYVGTQAASKALEYAGMGAALGPVGMGVGALVGAGVGIVNAKKEAAEAKKQAKIAERTSKVGDVQAQLRENLYGQGKNLNEKPMMTKKGVIKKLGAITGTMSPNMSMVQYKNENKFKSIAQKLEGEEIVDVLDSSTGKRTKLTKKDGSYYKAGQSVSLTENQKEFNKPDLLPKNDKPTKKEK